jgi:hypothetical protein
MWRQTVVRNWSSIGKTLQISQILTKVATANPLSPQLWRMWRQSECGWTPLA